MNTEHTSENIFMYMEYMELMKILSMLVRNYKKLDIELFPYCIASHAWFQNGTLHWAEIG